jgi:hypothetical protein
MEAISYFENGQVRKVAVPKVVGESLKGLSKKQADLVTRVASLGSSMLRQGATGLNVAFIPSNAIRDFQTLGITQGTGLVDTAAVWLQGLGEVAGQGKYFREWLEYGGSFSGFFETMRGPQREAKQLLRSPAARVARVEAHITALGEEMAAGRLSIREAALLQQSFLELLAASLEARRAEALAAVELARVAGLLPAEAAP